MGSQIDVLYGSIANGEQLSTAMCLNGGKLLEIDLPAAFTGTSLKLKGCAEENGTYQYLYQSGADLAYTCAQGKNVMVGNDVIVANWIKVESQSAEAAARGITLQVLRLD